MIKYKINVLEELKLKGYTTYTLRKERLIGEAMLQKIRSGELPSWKTLDIICNLLNCDISDIIEYIPDDKEKTQS